MYVALVNCRVTSYTELYGYTESVSARYGFYTDFYPYICRYGFLPKIYGFSKYTEFLGYGFFLQIRIFTKNIRIFEIYGFFPDTDFFCRYGFLPKLYGFLKYTDFFPDTDFFCIYGIYKKLIYAYK